MKIGLNTYSIKDNWQELGNTQEERIRATIALCNDMDIDQLEFFDAHFDVKDLTAHVKTFNDAGINVFSIGPHVPLLVKPDKAREKIEEASKWLNLAHDAGVPMVRFNLGDAPLPRLMAPDEDYDEEDWEEYREMIATAIEVTGHVINPLIEIAERLDTMIGIETHRSYSSDHEYMALFEKEYPSKNLGWIFDIGNYDNDEMRWKALDVIKKNTKYAHAKTYAFDDAGHETTLDYPKAFKILHEAGFKGIWSIECQPKVIGILCALRTNELCKYSLAKVQGNDYKMKVDFLPADALLKAYQDKGKGI
ncbi:MAG: sugar phosphate isomerase/epimerase family protein [Candidatus Hodarchaeota archaeon]